MIIIQFVKVLRGTLENSPKDSPDLCGEFGKTFRPVGEDVQREIHLPLQGVLFLIFLSFHSKKALTYPPLCL